LARGRFPQLADRDDLWRLLVVITTRKVRAQARRRLRQKRGGGQVQPASDLEDAQSDDDLLARAVGSEPTPEFAVMVAEEYRRLLDRLGDDVLRKVAILRMEGHTTDAIAGRLGCARRTIARQLALTRRILTVDAGADADSP
jgi:DNA-directed RNA polymerase specialized sigma24 family protein